MPRKRKAAPGGPPDPLPPPMTPDRTSADHRFTPLPLDRVHRLIEPGPVLLVSSGAIADRSHNLMTMGFHMMLQHSDPTLIGVCIGPWDATFSTLRALRQCVLAVPSVEMAQAVVDIGNCSRDEVGVEGSAEEDAGAAAESEPPNKWTRFGLEPLPAASVRPPLVGGPHIMANIECVVDDSRMVSRHALWVLKAVRAWWDEDMVEHTGRMMHHRGNGVFALSGDHVVDLHERMTKWQELA